MKQQHLQLILQVQHQSALVLLYKLLQDDLPDAIKLSLCILSSASPDRLGGRYPAIWVGMLVEAVLIEWTLSSPLVEVLAWFITTTQFDFIWICYKNILLKLQPVFEDLLTKDCLK